MCNLTKDALYIFNMIGYHERRKQMFFSSSFSPIVAAVILVTQHYSERGIAAIK